jgi:hypothetical protein
VPVDLDGAGVLEDRYRVVPEVEAVSGHHQANRLAHVGQELR